MLYWGATPDSLVVLHVGRLAPEKNLATLAAAFLAIRQQQPTARLLLVGDGPEARALRRRLPDAIFVGNRHGEDLAAHYASGDLFLFPSLTETFGNVTVEAMASGQEIGYATGLGLLIFLRNVAPFLPVMRVAQPVLAEQIAVRFPAKVC